MKCFRRGREGGSGQLMAMTGQISKWVVKVALQRTLGSLAVYWFFTQSVVY